jgi:hypothetical protein
MTKADYIHLFKEACGGKCNAEYNPCAYRQAANELSELEPVAWGYKNNKGEIHDCMTHESVDYFIPLYAFEEVEK